MDLFQQHTLLPSHPVPSLPLMRLTVLVPYSSSSSKSSSPSQSHVVSRTHSPKASLSGPSSSLSQARRGSITAVGTGLLGAVVSQLQLSPTAATNMLYRRRTIFGDPGWPQRPGVGGVCPPEALLEALDCFADCECFPSRPYLLVLSVPVDGEMSL